MAFLLEKVVPWGRRLAEYQQMFDLTELELKSKTIASFGDGPASFNAEVTAIGGSVLSLDPIYQFSREELQNRCDETRDIVMEQMRKNQENYRWDRIKSLEELEQLRMSAIRLFLSDFEQGLDEQRYQPYQLPERLACEDHSFDLGLSSHFLFLYPSLGLDFHLQALAEMLRVCKEIRIFPLVNLDGQETELTGQVIKHFEKQYQVGIRKVDYEFQKGADCMMVIKQSQQNVIDQGRL